MAMKLNDTQLTILSSSATRDNRRVLPLPKLKAPQAAITKTIKAMIADGLIEAIPANPGDEIWEHTEEHGNTTAGQTAIGIEDVPATSVDKPDKRRTPVKKAVRGAKTAKKASRARTVNTGSKMSKQDTLLKLLRSARGATVSEMQHATGWAPHSIRGWMSGTAKKKLGLSLASEKDEGAERRYFVGPLRAQ